MVKWFPEVMLQRYWQERCHDDDYDLQGRRILGARMNPQVDRFPDIIANRIDGISNPVPAEVEWTTDDFRHHGHPVEYLADSGGFLIVWKRTTDFPVPQIQIDPEKFRDWLGSKYDTLLTETVRDIDEQAVRSREPRLWLVYMSKSVRRHLDIGLANNIWGFPTRSPSTVKMYAQAVRKGDLLVFVGPWEWGATTESKSGGRVTLKIFKRGRLGSITAFSVTRSYFEDSTVVWPSKEGESWPHRIGIASKPLFDAEHVRANTATLGGSLPEFIRKTMIGMSDRPVEVPPTLIPSLLKAVNSPG